LNKLSSMPKDVDLIAQIADLKEIDYKNLLVLTTLVELLIEKGILTRQEILNKTYKLESDIILKDLL